MTGAELYPDFITAYPEFSGVPQIVAELQLELAADSLCARQLGKWWRHAVYLWAAHYLALRFDISDALEDNGMNPGMVSGGVATSVSAGTGSLSQSVSHSAMASGDNAIDADFARTGYGLQYLSLLDQVCPWGFPVISRW